MEDAPSSAIGSPPQGGSAESWFIDNVGSNE